MKNLARNIFSNFRLNLKKKYEKIKIVKFQNWSSLFGFFFNSSDFIYVVDLLELLIRQTRPLLEGFYSSVLKKTKNGQNTIILILNGKMDTAAEFLIYENPNNSPKPLKTQGSKNWFRLGLSK